MWDNAFVKRDSTPAVIEYVCACARRRYLDRCSAPCSACYRTLTFFRANLCTWFCRFCVVCECCADPSFKKNRKHTARAEWLFGTQWTTHYALRWSKLCLEGVILMCCKGSSRQHSRHQRGVEDGCGLRFGLDTISWLLNGYTVVSRVLQKKSIYRGLNLMQTLQVRTFTILSNVLSHIDLASNLNHTNHTRTTRNQHPPIWPIHDASQSTRFITITHPQPLKTYAFSRTYRTPRNNRNRWCCWAIRGWARRVCSSDSATERFCLAILSQRLASIFGWAMTGAKRSEHHHHSVYLVLYVCVRVCVSLKTKAYIIVCA